MHSVASSRVCFLPGYELNPNDVVLFCLASGCWAHDDAETWFVDKQNFNLANFPHSTPLPPPLISMMPSSFMQRRILIFTRETGIHQVLAATSGAV